MRALLIALVLLAACKKAPRAQPRPAPDAAAAVTAPAPDAGADCVATCVRASQMRATSIEQIERDCRAECSAAPAPSP